MPFGLPVVALGLSESGVLPAVAQLRPTRSDFVGLWPYQTRLDFVAAGLLPLGFVDVFEEPFVA